MLATFKETVYGPFQNSSWCSSILFVKYRVTAVELSVARHIRGYLPVNRIASSCAKNVTLMP